MINFVIKRDGKRQKFDPNKIKQAIFKASRSVFNDEEATKAVEITFPTILEKISSLEKKVLHIEEIQDIVEKALMTAGFTEIAKAYILYRKKRQDLRTIKESLGVKDDLKLSVEAIQILKERYLLKDENRKIIETPKQLFLRVAQSIAEAEKNYSKEQNYYAEKFYQIMSNLEFLPNSPTLMNAGTSLGQLAACFVLPVGDSILEIFETLKAMALIHKSGGGTGFNFSNIRPKADIVSSTKGFASGPISFMKIFDTATAVIVQGGRRRGANMGILRIDHPDVVEFITAKLKEQVLENFNLSVAITDEFMRALKANRDFYLINPRNKARVKKMKALNLFSLIAFCAYQSGEPGVVFLDTINRTHPLKGLGKIEATNPCGEVPLLYYEACNLGSINLAKFVENKKVNWEKLQDTVHIAVRFLDNVIEVNKYPLKQIEELTKQNRKIGLGVMGFADMLVKLRIPYDSKEAVSFAQKLMKFIRKSSLEASSKLAEERGVFSNWKYSVYAKKNLALRNATLNSIAPTGSISLIAGCSSGIEPYFSLSFVRSILGGSSFFGHNLLLEEVAREEGLYSKSLLNKIIGKSSIKNEKDIPKILRRLFVTTFDISYIDHLNIQSAFQKYTDNAVSKTINLAETATVEDVKQIYLKAYQLKLKGVTIYRYASRSQQVLYNLEDITRWQDSCFPNSCQL